MTPRAPGGEFAANDRACERGGIGAVSTAKLDRVRVGIVGCGFFGNLHAAKYASLDFAELVGAADIFPPAARRVSHIHGGVAFERAEQLLGHVDAVSITTPATRHFELAAMFMSEGVHVLVEKPLALELNHADELIRLADEKSLVLQVGHQERYVVESLGILSRDVAPIAIETQRAGPFTGRATDVCAVLDLMIHDLDIIHKMMRSDITEVTAEGRSLHSLRADEVTAKLTFVDGSTADILASRMSVDKKRSMRVVYPDGVIEVDFVGRTTRNSTKAPLTATFEQANGHAGVLNDPLGYGIQSFIESIRNGLPPRVSGPEARRALQTALRITERLAA